MFASTRCLDTTLLAPWYGLALVNRSSIEFQRGASVTNDRKRHLSWPDRRTSDSATSRVLPPTADQSAGFSNLATQPRAGNISSDTRAGY
jgi:hypothetical protein